MSVALRLNVNIALALTISILVVGLPSLSMAEVARATKLWGTADSSSGSTSAIDSAVFHETSGLSAGQVNAARRGILLSGPNLTVIGAQNIVQVTGDNNVVRNIDQSAVNRGNQTLVGQIN
jgi:hypothetical protein